MNLLCFEEKNQSTMHTLLLFIFLFLSTLTAQETVAIVTYKVEGMTSWDPDSVKKGITGSEEAVIYMAQQLADLGYRVVVLGAPPANSPYALPEANPRFVDADAEKDAHFDIAISWRMPWSAAALKKRAERVYFWPHDTPYGHISKKQIDDFDGVLWISEWQREQWILHNPAFAQFKPVFGNGINPHQFSPVQSRDNPYSCIYGSNYARGLEILLDIWPQVRQKFPKATLDVYYGWQHWGLLSTEKEAKMRAQVAALSSSGLSEHGLVSHEALHKAYEKASFWTYPCIAPETFCITALKAQLAGAVPVIIEGSALKETVRTGYRCNSPEEYLETLTKAMQNAEKITLNEREQMGQFVLREFTWKEVARKWKDLFDLKTAAVSENQGYQKEHQENKK